MGLPRSMKLLGLLQKHDGKKRGGAKPVSLGSKLTYDLVYDHAALERIVAACGKIVTSIEGELTNEVLLQHASDWATGLRAGFFPSSVTSPGHGNKKRNKKNATRKKKTVDAAPYLVGHFVRKQALWLIQAHQARGTCRVDYSQMLVKDLARLMPDSSNSLSKVGFSEKASVFGVVEGMDPLVVATFLCLFLPVEKKLSHMSAITNPSNHAQALRMIEEYKSLAAVPPLPSWLAENLANGRTQDATVADKLTQGETQEAPDGDHRSRDRPTVMTEATTSNRKDAHGLLTWSVTDPAPNKKLRCCCSGNCRGQCPGRYDGCPNVAIFNLPGERSDALHLPSSFNRGFGVR